tara:strand:+ start:891 stop:1142 length:252 start_codon:yes stop_codon:yes gene_type:complete
MANKIDIYQYSSATDVQTLTLSNCTSTSANDYMVIAKTGDADPSGSETTQFFKPASISGNTMTLNSTGAVNGCLMIMVVQQGD